jgi:quercetin dioxygenase-like cupin family protein
MYVVNHEERDISEVNLPGVEKTTVRWLIGRRSGAKTYAMRMFTMEPGGIIPLHTHPEEHQIFILEGEAILLSEDNERRIAKKDDVVFIPSNIPHGYDNRESDNGFRFICVIPLLEKSS